MASYVNLCNLAITWITKEKLNNWNTPLSPIQNRTDLILCSSYRQNFHGHYQRYLSPMKCCNVISCARSRGFSEVSGYLVSHRKTVVFYNMLLFSLIFFQWYFSMNWKLHSLHCFQEQSSNKAGMTLYIYWPSFLTRQRGSLPYYSHSRNLIALLVRFKFPANLEILNPSPTLMFSPVMHL